MIKTLVALVLSAVATPCLFWVYQAAYYVEPLPAEEVSRVVFETESEPEPESLRVVDLDVATLAEFDTWDRDTKIAAAHKLLFDRFGHTSAHHADHVVVNFEKAAKSLPDTTVQNTFDLWILALKLEQAKTTNHAGR